MSIDHKLADIRARIDALDVKLCALFSERAGLAAGAAAIKQQAGEEAAHFYRPEREAQILHRVLHLNQGPLSAEQLTGIYREIISACMAQEQQFRIAYLGPQGTFTQAAALKHFGHAVKTIALTSIARVFREVEVDNCAYGVVPVENSIEGTINQTLDMLINSSLQICGEVELRIHQNVMSKAGELGAIKKLYSHPQSLAQCRGWLDENLPGIERIAVGSNADAARRASQEDGAAAIGGATAAQHYDLSIIASNVEDETDNTTRFLVLGRQTIAASGKDKTSILFSMPSKPGSLMDMLACFARHNVNMTRIESRPSHREMWEYIFFVDVDGHQQDAAIAKAIVELNEVAAMMRVLGSYPRAVR